MLSLNEPLIGHYLGPFLADQPGADPRVLTTENFTVRRVESDKPDHFFAEAFSDVWAPGLGALIRAASARSWRGLTAPTPPGP